MSTYSTIKLENPAREVLVRVDDDGKEWFIPTDPGNSDYQAYLASQNGAVNVNN